MAHAKTQFRSSTSKSTSGTSVKAVRCMSMLRPSNIPSPRVDRTVSLQKTQGHNTHAPAPTTSLDLNHRFLLDVLQNHPKKEVSEVLWAKIVARDICIRGLSAPNADGRFKPMPVIDANGHLIKLMGTLFLSRDLVDRARRGDATSKSYLNLVLLHESVHYEQIASGRFSADVILTPARTREECDMVWKLEREAYFRECQFAMSMGQSKIITAYCTTLEPVAFDRNLYKFLQTNRTDICPTFWLNALSK